MKLSVVTLVLCLAWAASAPPAHAAPPSAPAVQAPAAVRAPLDYTDLGSYLSEDADIETWYTAVYLLRQGFDDICGDTFCEGDYSNIQPLRLRCSVERASGILGQCVWTFAASNEDVRPRTGRIVVDAVHWRCRLPIAPGTHAGDLLQALAVPSPLQAPLPGGDRSIYDALADCF